MIMITISEAEIKLILDALTHTPWTSEEQPKIDELSTHLRECATVFDDDGIAQLRKFGFIDD